MMPIPLRVRSTAKSVNIHTHSQPNSKNYLQRKP